MEWIKKKVELWEVFPTLQLFIAENKTTMAFENFIFLRVQIKEWVIWAVVYKSQLNNWAGFVYKEK